MLSVEERLSLIKEVGEEIIGEDELIELLKEGRRLKAYDGFEPSGNIHIAQGLMRAINVNKLTRAGVDFVFWVADWHGLVNNKMGGDLEKIRILGEYFIEVWKACGMDTKHVQFLWAAEHMNQEYWLRVLKIGMMNSVPRIIRCAEIMGRSEKENLSAAQIFYPCMQCSDIFHLDVDICQLGMDQRKVNVLAREVATKLEKRKPIAVHHHMLMGLQQGPADSGDVSAVERTIARKMSKSNPDSAIYMTDTPIEVERKLRKAFCPEGVADNPVLEYYKYIIFELVDSVNVERPEKFGGTLEFASYSELEAAYLDKRIHPADLKTTASKYINDFLRPVHKHFETNKHAKMLLEKVQSIS